MLTRLAIWGLAVLALVPAKLAIADDHPGPVAVSGDNRDGVVTTRVGTTGSTGGGGAASGATEVSASSCQWVQVFLFERLPLPDPSTVHGTWWQQYCNGNGWAGLPILVPNAAGQNGQVTPATLAQRAVNKLPLPAPEVRRNPAGDALVNLATWWWLDPAQWRPLKQRTAVGPVWAEVTAKPVRSVWDAGDGTPPLSCAGGGTPYDASRSPDAQSTGCSHTYTESSAGQPQTGPGANDRFFTVTVTVYWQVSFVGAGGAGGALPVMTRTTRFPLRVVERQTVVTGGSG